MEKFVYLEVLGALERVPVVELAVMHSTECRYIGTTNGYDVYEDKYDTNYFAVEEQ